MPVLLGRGHERQLGHGIKPAVAAALPGAGNKTHGSGVEGGILLESGIFSPVKADAAQVAVPDQKKIIPDGVRLPQQAAVFADQAVAGENQVLGGLVGPGGAVGIHAGAGARLMLHQVPPVSPLANRFVGSGQVHDHLSSPQGQQGGRRHGSPQVLANLHAQGGPPDPEQQVRTHRDILPGKAQFRRGQLRHRQFRAGAEPPALIKLPVGGQHGLRHDAENASVFQHRRHIIKLALQEKRQAQADRLIGMVPGFLHHILQCRFGPGQQGFLLEKVSAGVARQAQFREHQQVTARRFRLLHIFRRPAGIFHGIPQPHRRDGAAYPQKIQHSFLLM